MRSGGNAMNCRPFEMKSSEVHIIIRALMEELGYPIKGCIGICNGFSKTVMRRFFDGHIATTNELIMYMINDFLYMNMDEINKKFRLSCQPVRNDDDKKITGTLALFDEITSYQKSFEGDSSLTSMQFPSADSYNEFIIYLKSLYENHKKFGISVSFEISASYSDTQFHFEGHVINICYNHLSDRWIFIDVNQLPIKEIQDATFDDLLEFFTTALHLTGKSFTLFQSNLFTTNNNVNSLNKIVTDITSNFKLSVPNESTIGLNEFQKNALKILHNDGLTPTHLRGWNSNKGYFTPEHVEALTFLIRNRSLSPEIAISELCDLDRHHAAAITRGLSKNDVIGLTAPQIMAIEHLKEYGVDSTHLRSWKGKYFGMTHYHALKYLLENFRVQPNIAIFELNGLTQEQAQDIVTCAKIPDAVRIQANTSMMQSCLFSTDVKKPTDELPKNPLLNPY